jgi:cell division protein FtsI/penicillin-binding protein 2
MKRKKNYIILILIISLIAIFILYARQNKTVSSESKKPSVFKSIQSHLSDYYLDDENWPAEIEVGEQRCSISYTFNNELISFLKKMLLQHQSDYTSIVVIDNETFNLLAAIDYSKRDKKFGKALSFSSTNPAASLAKIITAADLLENTVVSKNSTFRFKGRSTTLYKYQLKDSQKHSREIEFKKAFARSNNVVFAKAALSYIQPSSLLKMADAFGFNRRLLDEFSIGISHFPLAEDDYHFAELASGFNKETLISPVHAAMLGAVIANGGYFSKPSLIDNVRCDKEYQQFKNEQVKIMSDQSNQELAEMMEMTVGQGTARSLNKALPRRILSHYNIGAKTGSITGGLPYGKRDWLVAYMKPKDNSSKGISIAVMIVNHKKWYIRSTLLANKIMQYYHGNLITREK